MHVVRRLSIRVATLAAAILAVGGLALNAGAATADASVRPAGISATAASPDFTCTAGYTCFFSGDNFNDTWWELENSQWDGGIPHYFSDLGISPNPGSAHMDGGSSLWLENTSNGDTACAYNAKIVLDHNYNEFWINYGVDTC
jgi:hypothetical protein